MSNPHEEQASQTNLLRSDFQDHEADTALHSAGGTTELDDLADVNVPAPDDGDVLTYDGGTAAWIAEVPTGGGVTDHGALTGLGDDDHPQYTTAAEATTVADASVATHTGLGDPHTGYRLESADHSHAATGIQAGTIDHGVLTGLADDDHPQYETSAEVDTKVATHAGLADPHTGYRLESADHTHASTGIQAGTLDHGTALTGLGDDDHPQYALDTDLTTHAGAADPHTGYLKESVLSEANAIDLTDGGATVLHSHAGGALTDFAPAVLTPALIGAQQDNYAPAGIADATILRLSTAADFTARNITGIDATQAAGQVLIIQNVGTVAGSHARLTLVNDSASSTAANRILCPGAENIDINLTDSVLLVYDATALRWRTVGSAAWLSPTSTNANINMDAAATTGTANVTSAAISGHGHRLNTYSTVAAPPGTESAGTSATAPSRGNHVHGAFDIQYEDAGSVSIITAARMDKETRLGISGTERVTMSGTGRLRVNDDLQDPANIRYRAPGSTLLNVDEYALSIDRIDLRGNTRQTMVGNSRRQIDNLRPASRLVLAGRG